MKKIIAIILCIVILILLSVNSYARTLLLTYDGAVHKYTGSIFSMKVNDEPVSSDVPPVVIDRQLLVPVRAVFEKLGGTLQWERESQKMSIDLEGAKIEFTAGDENARVNGKPIKMDFPAKLINYRLMAPLSFIGGQLKMSTALIDKESLITINSPGKLKNVEYFSRDGKDHVSIALDDYKDYNIMRITSPDRIVIDFLNTNYQDKMKKIDVNGKLVKSIRYAQFDDSTARVVLDVFGQPQYQVEEEKTRLNLYIENPTYKNTVYNNNGDRICLILNGAKLTEGGEEIKKLYKGKYDSSGKKYTVTFSSKLADLKSGIMKINDGMLNSIQITNNIITRKTSIIFNAKDKFFYEIITRPEVNNTAVTIFKPVDIADKLVVIDPGHGGREPGAIYGDIYEKDINLDIALRLKKLLTAKKVKTYMIREDDSFVGLYERGYIANDLNAALFLSIHNNAIDDPDYAGTMTLYFPQDSDDVNFNGKRFAGIIQDKLLRKLKTTDRKIIERPNLIVLRASVMPSALAEIAYLTNENDRNRLQKDLFRQKAAQALCDAVVQALKEIRQV